MDNLNDGIQAPDLSMLPGIDLPSGIAFSLDVIPPMARLIFRGNPEAAKAAGTAFGISVPCTPCEALHTEGRAALWLGPDEWLLLAFEEEADAVMPVLNAALTALPHSLVDISSRQISLAITGANAARALSSGCPLDFHRLSFPVDMVARTIFMKAEIMIWRRAETHFHIEVARSYADYTVRHLIEAARHAPVA